MNFKLGERHIGAGSPTYFIADIAANHDGDLNRAIDLIYLAKESGADCAKFQHFEAGSIVSDKGFRDIGKLQTHQSGWEKSVSEIYDQYHTKRDWDEELIKHCKLANIDFMTTPYNIEAIDHFSNFMHAFKVGSGDITYKPLLQALNNKGKPVFLATGAADIDDTDLALSELFDVPVCLMQCNTNYTGDLDNFNYVNLNVLRTFSVKYPNLPLGFSDHTPGHAAVLGSIALGAVAVEKHFTDDNSRVGPDHSFALNPITWRDMIDRSRELECALGDGVKRIEDNEKNTVIVQRRAIRSVRNLKAGHTVELSDITFLRPCAASDLSPMNLDKLIGQKLKSDIAEGESFKWTHVDI